MIETPRWFTAYLRLLGVVGGLWSTGRSGDVKGGDGSSAFGRSLRAATSAARSKAEPSVDGSTGGAAEERSALDGGAGGARWLTQRRAGGER
jgi:hypothetical protein